MKSVANKMRFQIAREDREALKDQSNKEFQEYLEYQKEQSIINNQYLDKVENQEREAVHEIIDIKIEDIKRTKEAKEQELQIAQNIRSQNDY